MESCSWEGRNPVVARQTKPSFHTTVVAVVATAISKGKPQRPSKRTYLLTYYLGSCAKVSEQTRNSFGLARLPRKQSIREFEGKEYDKKNDQARHGPEKKKKEKGNEKNNATSLGRMVHITTLSSTPPPHGTHSSGSQPSDPEIVTKTPKPDILFPTPSVLSTISYML